MKKLVLVLMSALVIVILVSSLLGCSSPAPSPAATAPSSPTATSSTPTASSPVAKAPITLRLGEYQNNIYPANAFINMWIDKVNKKAAGQMVVTMIGGSEAIPAPDLPAAAQRGSIDIADCLYSASDTLANGVKCIGHSEIGVSDMRKNGAFDYGNSLFNKAKLMWLGSTSPSLPQTQIQWYLNKKVEKLSDFNGLKLACPSPTYVPFGKALGATPVTVNMADYYTAMERGTVDGFNWAPVGVAGYMEPVTKYMLNHRFGSSASGTLMNMDSWNKLPKAMQDVLVQASTELDAEGPAVWSQLDKDLCDKIQKAGVQFITFTSADDAKKFHDIYRESTWKSLTDQYPEQAAKFKALISP